MSPQHPGPSRGPVGGQGPRQHRLRDALSPRSHPYPRANDTSSGKTIALGMAIMHGKALHVMIMQGIMISLNTDVTQS